MIALVMGEGAIATRQVVKLLKMQQHFIRLRFISKSFKVLV